MAADLSINLGDSEIATQLVAGPLDASQVPAFRVALIDMIERTRGTIVVDLTGTSSLDPAAAAVLVGCARRLAAHGGRLVLHAPSPQVLATLSAHGLHRYLPVITHA
jgi:anti-anti-sigma factor